MRKRREMRWCVLLLSAALSAGLAGCGSEGTPASGDTAQKSWSPAISDEVVTITMYPADANISSGVVGGHKGVYFADNGFELEVWAYSDEKTNAILASGDLPDIIYVSKDNLDVMIEAGMLLNLEEHLDQMPHVLAYEPMEAALHYVREFRSAGTGELYALPLTVGDNQTKEAIADSTERNAVKLRWDVYEEIGAPEIKDIWELINVMEQMLTAHPTDADGTPCYGTVLNSGSDTSYWACMVMFYRWHGYLEEQLPYLLEADMVNGTFESILSEDSLYYKGLQWYNEVYRRGLMDPDSINNDRATQKAKVDAGYAMVPAGCLPGWVTRYYEYYIPGSNIYFDYTSKYGDPNKVIAINANTENLDACLKLLDMWCDPDAYLRIINGPDGDFWYSDGENAYLTDETLEHLRVNGPGTGDRKYATGEDASLWNTSFCLNTGAYTSYQDGKGNYRILRTQAWQEAQEITTSNETFDSWKKTTGFDSWKEWLESEQAYYSNSPLADISSFCSKPDDRMQLTIDALREVVVNASWKMVYAESRTEFNKIWEQMLSDCEGLGAQSIMDWRMADIENAAKIRDSLQK